MSDLKPRDGPERRQCDGVTSLWLTKRVGGKAQRKQEVRGKAPQAVMVKVSPTARVLEWGPWEMNSIAYFDIVQIELWS